jgi:NAD(P)-dependent dehydrogenase (short-subunit alcohol dehydrogenase family)
MLTVNWAGSRGLGLHTATAFLLAGAQKVIISARKNEGPEGIDQAVEKLNKLNVSGKAVGIAANVADTEAIEKLVKQVEETDGKLDILVCNAGATWGGPFEPTPDWSSKKVLDLNVRGVFNLARLCVSHSFSRG